MRDSVASTFPAFTASFEGRTGWMYQDVKGLVTCGVGNLIDPVEYALGLPWTFNGAPADQGTIRSWWSVIKESAHGMLASWYARQSPLRLSDADVDALVMRKMGENDAALSARFSFWEQLPADAQLAVHSMAWACGPAFRFPRFEAALASRDWAECAVECHLDETGNPGLAPRNAANESLFLSAASGDPSLVNGWGPRV